MKTPSRQTIETPTNTSLVCSSVEEPLNSKSVSQPRREKTSEDGCMSSKYSVFVLDQKGKPLTPTTPCKARKLLKADVAKKYWSKFGIFGIQLLVNTRKHTEETCIGNDWGTRFDGYSIISGNQNVLNAMLLLPSKKHIVKKLVERRILRRERRKRNSRRRAERVNNRKRRTRINWLSPSQTVIVHSRLKIIKELYRIYPISISAIEDVKVKGNTQGYSFSTVEVGKTKLRNFFRDKNTKIFEFQGYQTQKLRKKYNYKKTSVKSAEKFTAHCSDSLTLAVETSVGIRVPPGKFIVVDDRYRATRRRLHVANPKKGGVRKFYTKGTICGLRKGIIIGTTKVRAGNRAGQLCGRLGNEYLYNEFNATSKDPRKETKTIDWISTNFVVRNIAA